MENNEKTGCVYFFRHKSLTPVKIGMSSSLDCHSRFKSFCTYAPYGGIVIACILTEDPRGLEARMHELFSEQRLNGEWFDITAHDIKSAVRGMTCSHANLTDESSFDISDTLSDDKTVRKLKLSLDKAIKNGERINKSMLAEKLGVSRSTLYNLIRKHKL